MAPPRSGLPGGLGHQVEADVVVEDCAARFVRGGRDKQVWTSKPSSSTVSPKRRASSKPALRATVAAMAASHYPWARLSARAERES